MFSKLWNRLFWYFRQKYYLFDQIYSAKTNKKIHIEIETENFVSEMLIDDAMQGPDQMCVDKCRSVVLRILASYVICFKN